MSAHDRFPTCRERRLRVAGSLRRARRKHSFFERGALGDEGGERVLDEGANASVLAHVGVDHEKEVGASRLLGERKIEALQRLVAGLFHGCPG
jgi:hypothetical protein